MKTETVQMAPSIVHLEKCTEAVHYTAASETRWRAVDHPTHGRFFILSEEGIMGAVPQRLYDLVPGSSETQQGLYALVESYLKGEDIPPGVVIPLSEMGEVNELWFLYHDKRILFEY